MNEVKLIYVKFADKSVERKQKVGDIYEKQKICSPDNKDKNEHFLKKL